MFPLFITPTTPMRRRFHQVLVATVSFTPGIIPKTNAPASKNIAIGHLSAIRLEISHPKLSLSIPSLILITILLPSAFGLCKSSSRVWAASCHASEESEVVSNPQILSKNSL
jgi:hypothetical protein